MTNRYLLTAGSAYYPSYGTGDWIATYPTYEDARNMVKEIITHQYYTKGKHKGEIKETHTRYKINESTVDWYEIIDLSHWI
jgi:GH25 family lysozyme M1 (1,4-beta-N-acetylmuramidase)